MFLHLIFSDYFFWVLIFHIPVQRWERGEWGKSMAVFSHGQRKVWPRTEPGQWVGAGSTIRGAPGWLGAGSSSPTLLDASPAPLFPAEEFAACTTGTTSGIKCGWRGMFRRAELSLLLAGEWGREEGVPGLCCSQCACWPHGGAGRCSRWARCAWHHVNLTWILMISHFLRQICWMVGLV